MYSILLLLCLLCLGGISWESSSNHFYCGAVLLPTPVSFVSRPTSTFFLSSSSSLQNQVKGDGRKSIQLNGDEDHALEEEVSIIGSMLPGDPYVTGTITQGVTGLFSVYNTILLVRIGLSWFPQLFQQFPILRTLQVVTDPYLGVFRKVIPSIGGLDISPIPAIYFLDIMSQTAAVIGADVGRIEKIMEKNKKIFQETFHFKI